MEISKINIREHRESLGLSQSRLSELSGIPQSILSAVEHGKKVLSDQHKKALMSALSDKTKIEELASRGRRYKAHTYAQALKLEERVNKACLSKENPNYLASLQTLYSEHLKNEPRELSAISLFSGCGGLSLGFSAAQYKIKAFLEIESALRKIYKLNFPESIELGGDITKFESSSLSVAKALVGNIDVIIGGPPCQGFSLSGKRKVGDPRNELFRNYLAFVDAFKPKVAILENVRLLTSMKNDDGALVKDEIIKGFVSHGYKINFFEVNAKDYGVPQHRERVIFVAIRNDLKIEPSFPEPLFNESFSLFHENNRCRTFADACSDLEFLESGERSVHDDFHAAVSHPAHVINWLWNVPEGCSAHDNDDPNNRPPSGYNTTYKRQVWSEPAATVQTTFGMISGCRNVHPIATRSLTIREAARLQSFPDQYKFIGNLGNVRKGIGNAVPPLLAYAIATHVKKIIQAYKSTQPPN